MEFSRSSQAFAEAQHWIPGGVDSPARAFGAVGCDPLFIERAAGAYLYDLDGNALIDYIGSWGPMILGHAHPEVTAALEKAIQQGTSYGTPTLLETRLAQKVVAAIPSIEMVRFVNSGTEATMSAIRLARGFTGRNKIVKFEGNYHGHADSLLVAAGSAAATFGVPNSPGVTPGTSQDTLVLPYNNAEKLLQTMEDVGKEVAGIIFEPIVGNMGCVVATEEFCAALREVRELYGILLICDEVMTGFRVDYRGAQHLLKIQPDITTLGKIIGGGLPVGAYGGLREIMRQILPSGPVFQAGTLSGNPLAMTAGLCTLEILEKTNPYPYLEQLSAELAAGIAQAAKKHNIPLCVNRVGSMMTFFFQEGPVYDWETASRSDTRAYAHFFREMLHRGIYFPCSQFEALFVSAAHREEHIRETIHAADTIFAEMKTK
ncbi:MAG: glutamate-1-semialdehyde 2,1-aminomutase [Planctomycetia bacterium]|nr:glutamate-1-semialdehyde 2,1-aminomutase [Planctomycetia bacterium]